MANRSFKIRKSRSADLFDNFIESERAQSGWRGNGFLAEEIEIVSTKAIAGEFLVEPEAAETVIRPAPFYKLVGVLLLMLAAYVWWYCYRVFIYSMFPEPMGLVCLLAASAAIVGILIYFLHKRNNYVLRIGYPGISFRGKSIAWPELTETAILWKRRRRTRRCWLVLFRRGGGIEKLKLAMLDISEDALAAVVEQYKAGAGEYGGCGQ